MDSQKVWEEYYKSTNKELIYPDENLIRIIEKIYNPGWKRVLDFGCGNGRHLFYLKKKRIPELVGIDFSGTVIERNKKKSKDITFLTYNTGHAIPFENNYFDTIIVWGVLHYNPKPVREFLLNEFYRILRPGGYLVGTYRAKTDTHFFKSDVRDSFIDFFDVEDIIEELGNFSNLQLSYGERTPLGDLFSRIAHYYFVCQK